VAEEVIPCRNWLRGVSGGRRVSCKGERWEGGEGKVRGEGGARRVRSEGGRERCE